MSRTVIDPSRPASPMTASADADTGASDSTPVDLMSYRRIALLTEGHSVPAYAKTAINLLRYRPDDIVAVIDSHQAGSSAGALFNTGNGIPVVASVTEVSDVDAVFVGIAPPGGRLPEAFRRHLLMAIERGIDVVSGLHELLVNNREMVALAKRTGARLTDVRRTFENYTATKASFRAGCTRVHTVGNDCSVGKMVTALEIDRELRARGYDSQFLATGQTGIMVSGEGVPIDAVVSDFVNGAAEQLVLRNQHHDFLLIEGQGCITHPAFSSVTLGLLHGCAPQGLILCYEAGRKSVKSFQNLPHTSLETLRELYEVMASQRHPCRVIGVAINGRNLSADEALAERQRIRDTLQLPVCDVYRDGPAELVDAVLHLHEELHA